jgi:hypothetical protein
VPHDERGHGVVGRNSAQTFTRLALAEKWDDFLCEAAERSPVIGLARDRHDEVVDPCVDHRLQPLLVLFGRSDYGAISYYGGDAVDITAGVR